MLVGVGGITIKILANLDDGSIIDPTANLNMKWKSGQLPEEWKATEVRLVPKPGSPQKTYALYH